MEGTADRQLFSNLLTHQLPYVTVDAVDAASVSLAGGSLLGLNPGTVLVVHEVGARRADPPSAIATLEVREVFATTSVAEVVGGEMDAGSVGAWAFVTDRTYGDLSLRVRLDASLPDFDRQHLEEIFTEPGIIEVTADGADVVVADRAGFPEARTSADDLELARGAANVVRVVEEFARNRYLRRLSFEATDVRVELDFSPVEVERDRLGRAVACGEAVWNPSAHADKSLGGAQWSMSPGDGYRLRARNVGERRAFVAILDLLPKGAIQVLRPRRDEAPSSYEVDVGGTMDLGCYEIADEVGHEVLKMFATRTPQDFRAMFETPNNRGPVGDLSALEAVLASTFTATRSSQTTQPEGAATTRSILIRVTPN